MAAFRAGLVLAKTDRGHDIEHGNDPCGEVGVIFTQLGLSVDSSPAGLYSAVA